MQHGSIFTPRHGTKVCPLTGLATFSNYNQSLTCLASSYGHISKEQTPTKCSAKVITDIDTYPVYVK